MANDDALGPSAAGPPILVVEDDDGQALLTERSLRKQGYDVVREATGSGCLARLKTGGEHVVLLDLGLPDMTGQDVLAEIIGRSDEIPVIVVTGVDDLTVAVDAIRKGAWDYVVKRPDLSHLRELPHVIRRNQDRQRLVHERNLYRSMLSHDIKNPLHIILNYADMIEDEPHLGHESRMMLQRIKDNAASTLSLVNNFIEVSRIEAGKLVFERRPVCCASLVRKIVERQAPLAAAKGVALRLTLATDETRTSPGWSGDPMNARAHDAMKRTGTEDRWQLLADRGALERAVTNLVSNAIKFTPAGGTVDLEIARAGGELSIAVRDTGRGIPAADLPIIFEKYRRAREAVLTEGSGLGLFIVKAIVDGHGGSVAVDSTVEGGSTFTIRLPVEGAAAHEAGLCA